MVDKEKYTLLVQDSKKVKWRVSFDWLINNLNIPSLDWYLKVNSMVWQLKSLEKELNFLRKFHKDEIVIYFRVEIIKVLQERTKQFHTSTILDKIKCSGLWEERHEAWDQLIEEKVIVEGSRGWYKKGEM